MVPQHRLRYNSASRLYISFRSFCAVADEKRVENAPPACPGQLYPNSPLLYIAILELALSRCMHIRSSLSVTRRSQHERQCRVYRRRNHGGRVLTSILRLKVETGDNSIELFVFPLSSRRYAAICSLREKKAPEKKNVWRVELMYRYSQTVQR